MYVVGLTGGIGSGKSTVAQLFADLGVPVLDTDQVAREVVAPGEPVLQNIVETFGTEAITLDGELNRAWLRQKVFSDDHARQQLEAMLHPLIRKRCMTWLAQQQADYAILVIPLLFEKGWETVCDRVLVVDVPEVVQRQRVLQRDGGSAEQVEAIIRSQIDRNTRLSRADDIIDNKTARDALANRVAELHARYQQMAKEKQS